MKISRRTFGRLSIFAGAAALLPNSSGVPAFADAPLTAQQIADRIIAIMGPVWNPASYRDTFKMGDPDTPVGGVASCFMSTFDVIKRAHEKGLNFVITHEPTIWTDADLLPPVQNDPLYKLKLEYVNDNKMVLWRTHDSWHKMQPEPMNAAQNKKFGWDKYAIAGDPKACQFPSISLRDVVVQYAEKTPTESVRVIGNPDSMIKSLTRCGHSCEQNIQGLEKYDATISIEAREFETAEYGRDLLASGAKGAMIIASHESGEENGMELFTNWFKENLPGIHIEFIPTTDRLWTL
jgi:putative NIF3 family GTP cyclohydrolase 1 type 2